MLAQSKAETVLTLVCSGDNILPRFVGAAAVGACELCALVSVVVVVDVVVAIATAGCRLLALLVVGGVVGALLEFLVSAELFHRPLLLACWD